MSYQCQFCKTESNGYYGERPEGWFTDNYCDYACGSCKDLILALCKHADENKTKL